jgi:hypothetical protein
MRCLCGEIIGDPTYFRYHVRGHARRPYIDYAFDMVLAPRSDDRLGVNVGVLICGVDEVDAEI